MNVSEMENLIQQITDQICQQLLSSSYSVALAEAKEAFPEEMFVRFPDVNWVTKEPVSYTHLTLPTNTVTCRSRWSPDH